MDTKIKRIPMPTSLNTDCTAQALDNRCTV